MTTKAVMKKYKLGIMTNCWTVEATNLDIAVVVIRLFTQSSVPVAIYSPEEESQFSFVDDKSAKNLESFLLENKVSIKTAFKTLKTISK